MMLPSKKLLSEIFGYEVLTVSKAYASSIMSTTEQDALPTVTSIYHLMHLMKQWALTKHFILYSAPDLCIVKSFANEHIVDFGLETEFDSVTRSCEWILKETHG